MRNLTGAVMGINGVDTGALAVAHAAGGRQENIAISDIIGYDAYSYDTTGQHTENS